MPSRPSSEVKANWLLPPSKLTLLAVRLAMIDAELGAIVGFAGSWRLNGALEL